MYKLFLHPTEKPSEERKTKAAPLLCAWLEESPQIQKEFAFCDSDPYVYNGLEYRRLTFVSNKENPDLLVQKIYPLSQKIYPLSEDVGMSNFDLDEIDHCAFEFKSKDFTPSLNSGFLEDELTRMRAKYPKLNFYLVVVDNPEITKKDLARAFTICQRLNIRFKYCESDKTFAPNVFDLIRFPPKEEVDIGQRFVIKSSGSEFNRSLQCYHGVTRVIADKIESKYTNWCDLIDGELAYNDESMQYELDWETDMDPMGEFFTTESGRFMKANMERFLKKVSGK